MATIIVPNAGSTFLSSACLVGSKNRWAWIGFQTGSAAGSCTWYQTNASTSGCELMGIALGAYDSVLYGPFNSPCGLYAAGVNGGCAVGWLKQDAS